MRARTLTLALVSLAATAQAQTIQTWSGSLAGDRLGWSLASAPDTDLDGKPDVLLGVPFAPVASVQMGAARLHTSSGGALLNEYVGDAALDHAGWSVAGLGDLDGDGRGELVVGLPDSDDTQADTGLVRVHSGLDGSELFAWSGAAAGEAYGHALANAGDVNGDGRDDVVVGAWKASSLTGRVELRSGLGGSLLRSHVGAAAGDRFGFAVAGVGDVDGDGFADYAVGAPQTGLGSGYARVYSGASGAMLRAHVGLASGDQCGAALAELGDVDGDGQGEYALASPEADAGGTGRGLVRVFSGKSGLPVWSAQGLADGDRLGSALDGGLDVDGDLVPDLLVGAPFGAGGRGSARVLSGTDGSSLRSWSGTAGGDRFGAAVALSQDLDGDGVPDVLVGAPREDAGATDAGAAYAFSGASSCGPTVHCTAKVNSLGCLPTIQWSGSPTLSGPDDFVVRGLDVLGTSVGTMIYTDGGPAAAPALGGTLCVSTPFLRSAPIQAGGVSEFDCSGELDFAFTQAFMLQHGWSAGDRIDVQFWSRDFKNTDGTGSSLSDALGIVLCP